MPWLTYSLPLEGLCCCNAIKLQKCVVGFVILYFLQLLALYKAILFYILIVFVFYKHVKQYVKFLSLGGR